MKVWLRQQHPRPLPTLKGREANYGQGLPGPWWAETDDNGWTFAVQLAQKGETLAAAKFEVFPTHAVDSSDHAMLYKAESIPGNGLTRTVVHSFSLTQLIAEGVRLLTTLESTEGIDFYDWTKSLALGGIDWKKITPGYQKTQRGRPPLADEELALVAYLYVKAIREKVKSPIKFVADALDDPNPDRISQVVLKCRQRGFLTPAPAKGIAGGHLTDKAIEVLRRIEKEADTEGGNKQ